MAGVALRWLPTAYGVAAQGRTAEDKRNVAATSSRSGRSMRGAYQDARVQ
jgi:hypothetical protein